MTRHFDNTSHQNVPGFNPDPFVKLDSTSHQPLPWSEKQTNSIRRCVRTWSCIWTSWTAFSWSWYFSARSCSSSCSRSHMSFMWPHSSSDRVSERSRSASFVTASIFSCSTRVRDSCSTHRTVGFNAIYQHWLGYIRGQSTNQRSWVHQY